MANTYVITVISIWIKVIVQLFQKQVLLLALNFFNYAWCFKATVANVKQVTPMIGYLVQQSGGLIKGELPLEKHSVTLIVSEEY
jgi:hypothetical protein